jgi:hypothetical protein
MGYRGVHFKMPEQELQEMRDLISEKSSEIPGLTISNLIREGIRNEMWRLRNGNSDIIAEELHASKFFEIATDFFREMRWKKTE